MAILLCVSAGCRHAAVFEEGPSTIPPKEDLVIHRDTWGVPHIFGKTNADAAFGMAYAHAEDDFATMQTTLLASRGLVGRYRGKEGAAIDFFVKLFQFPEKGEEKLGEMSDEFIEILEAYVAGLNYYAELHPKEVQYKIFPVRPADIISGYMMSIASFIGVPGRLSELFGESRRRSVSKYQGSSDNEEHEVRGSNAFAFAPSRTADGSTILVANTHQPWTGPLAWYEAHVRSEEGWNVAGGYFPGSPVPTVGFNENLGWTHTVNRPDLIDTYVLTMHPTDPLKYEFDGEWLELEERTLKLNVRLWGLVRINVKRKVYRSVHGPVVKTDHGVYAIRYGGYDDAGALDQWFQMGKAKTVEDWKRAMSMHELPMFNTVFADRTGNIGYIYNASLPVRNQGYDWSLYLPGDTSATLWESYLPFDELPKVINPPSGFVQNCNATPFTTTDGSGNPDPNAFALNFGIERHMNNRELRAMELYGGDHSLTFDEVLAYKYDMKYSDESAIAWAINELKAVNPPADSLSAAALDVLLKWNRETNPENLQAALGVLTFHGRLTGRLIRNATSRPGTEDVMASLKASAELLTTHYGSLEVPWSEVNRLQRGSVDLGVGGGPDVLHAVYGRIQEDGQAVGTAGDSHIWVVKWNPDGSMETRSIHPFGSATSRPASPHYADQSPLFVNRILKTLWFDEKEIMDNLERSYFPED